MSFLVSTHRKEYKKWRPLLCMDDKPALAMQKQGRRVARKDEEKGYKALAPIGTK